MRSHQGENVQTQGFHHVAIICSDYDRSKYFYTQILGFEIIEETYRAERQSYKLDLRVGEKDAIELFSFPDPPARPSRPEACGLRHLSFAVADLDKAVEELQAKGVTVEPVRVDALTGKRFTFFQDPDQLPLEIYEANLSRNSV
jgi:glyoxylase I family protein